MTQAAFDVFDAKLRLLKDIWVGLETDKGAVRFARGFTIFLLLEVTLFERSLDELTSAMTSNLEFFGERINRLSAHAIQAHAKLKHIVVVFGPRIDFRYAINHLPQRNTATKIADRDLGAFDVDVDLL